VRPTLVYHGMSDVLPTLISPSDVAAWLAVPVRRVERMARDGEIPAIRLPTGEFVFAADDLAAWLDALRDRRRHE
jgi:excisionase family DNA binding protein